MSLFIGARFSSLSRLFARSGAGQQSLITLGGNFLSAGLMALAMIVLGRVMGPREFGVFSVSVSLMFILNRLIDAGFNQLIPRFVGNWYQRPKKQQAFLSYVIYWQLILASALLVLALVLLPMLARWLNYPYQNMILWSVLGAIVLALYSYLYTLLTAKQAFLAAGVINVGQSLLKAILFGLIIVFWQSDLNLIAAAYFMAPFVTALIFLLIFREPLLFSPKRPNAMMMKRINQFWWHAAVSVFAISLINNLDVLLVQRQLSEFNAGLYAGAVRMASFFGIIVVSIASVLNSRVARYSDTKTIARFLKKSRILLPLAVLLCLAILPLSRWLIIYSLGVDFLPGQALLNLLIINTFLSMLTLPLTAVFYAVDKPSYFSYNALIQIVAMLAISIYLLPMIGAAAVAWGRIVGTLLALIYSFVEVKKVVKD